MTGLRVARLVRWAGVGTSRRPRKASRGQSNRRGPGPDAHRKHEPNPLHDSPPRPPTGCANGNAPTPPRSASPTRKRENRRRIYLNLPLSPGPEVDVPINITNQRREPHHRRGSLGVRRHLRCFLPAPDRAARNVSTCAVEPRNASGGRWAKRLSRGQPPPPPRLEPSSAQIRFHERPAFLRPRRPPPHSATRTAPAKTLLANFCRKKSQPSSRAGPRGWLQNNKKTLPRRIRPRLARRPCPPAMAALSAGAPTQFFSASALLLSRFSPPTPGRIPVKQGQVFYRDNAVHPKQPQILSPQGESTWRAPFAVLVKTGLVFGFDSPCA